MTATASAADGPDRPSSGVRIDGETTVIRSIVDGSDVRVRVHSYLPPLLDVDGHLLDPYSARLVASAVASVARAITQPAGWPSTFWSDPR